MLELVEVFLLEFQFLQFLQIITRLLHVTKFSKQELYDELYLFSNKILEENSIESVKFLPVKGIN